jgi:hypothetical protein
VLKYRVKYDDGREELTGLQGARIFRGRPPAWARAAGGQRKNGTDRENGAEWGGRGTDEAVDRKGKAKAVERDPPGVAQTRTGRSSRPWHGPEVGWFLRLLGDEYSPDQQGFQAAWAKYEGTASALPAGVTKAGAYYVYTYREEASSDVHVAKRRSLSQLWFVLGRRAPVSGAVPEVMPKPRATARRFAATATRGKIVSGEAGPSAAASASKRRGGGSAGGSGKRSDEVRAGGRGATGGRLTDDQMKAVCAWMKDEGWCTRAVVRKGPTQGKWI